MDKVITYDMLDVFGPTIKAVYQLLYPNGLTMQQLADSKRRSLRMIYEYFAKEE